MAQVTEKPLEAGAVEGGVGKVSQVIGAVVDVEFPPGTLPNLMDALLPRYVETQVYEAVLENQASEHSARMVAMQNATNAAGDLIDSYTLTANKIRQAAITAELMDIVGGAEALRKE